MSVIAIAATLIGSEDTMIEAFRASHLLSQAAEYHVCGSFSCYAWQTRKSDMGQRRTPAKAGSHRTYGV